MGCNHGFENHWFTVKVAHIISCVYSLLSTKNLVKAQNVGVPCSDLCLVKEGMDNVQTIFKTYWDLANYDTQPFYIGARVFVTLIERPTRKDMKSNRILLNCYIVLVQGNQISVCKTDFLIFMTSVVKTRNVLMETQSSVTGIPPSDRHDTTSAKKIPERWKDLVVDFIKALPVCSSHYSLSKSCFSWEEAGSKFSGIQQNLQHLIQHLHSVSPKNRHLLLFFLFLLTDK